MFILDYRNNVDKNQFWAIFLFEFKMGCKAVETTHNINHTFGPGTANECTVQWWFKKFCKGDKSLLKVDGDQLRATTKADPLRTTQEIAEEVHVDHSTVIWHLKQIGKVKKLCKWVPHVLTENFFKSRFEVSSFSYSIQQWITSQIVTCDEKWVLCKDQLSGWTKKLQSTCQSQTCTQRKIMVIVWWSAVCLIHYSFLNPCKTITSETYAQQIDEIHQNCNAWSQQWSTKWAQFSTTTPSHMSHNQHFKSWMN